MHDSKQINKAYLLLALSLDFAPVEKILKNTGVSIEILEQADNIDLKVVLKVLRNIKHYSPNPIWPSTLGSHLGINTHGPVGYATISAPTLGKALATFLEWGQIRFETYTGEIIEHDETVEIIISDTTGYPELKEVFFESFMRAFEVLNTLILGKQPKEQTQLHFERPAEPDIQALMIEEYDSKLFFGAERNKLLIPKQIWFARSPLYDKDSYEFNLRKCQQLLNERNHGNRPDLTVKSAISKHFDHVIQTKPQEKSPPSLAQISQLLYMSERTLNRKLKLYNTSYKLILEKERATTATRLLSDARYTISDISELLGYRESANFCRAFKQWYGLSPTAYRRKPPPESSD